MEKGFAEEEVDLNIAVIPVHHMSKHLALGGGNICSAFDRGICKAQLVS